MEFKSFLFGIGLVVCFVAKNKKCSGIKKGAASKKQHL
jgi:hypothetical protein